MKKKVEIVEEVVEKTVEAPKARLSGDFGRADLNDMRDAINELHAK